MDEKPETRKIVPYVRRDDISWWAGCRYEPVGTFERYGIHETSAMTRWGARWAARRLAKKARKLREKGLAGYREDVGPGR